MQLAQLLFRAKVAFGYALEFVGIRESKRSRTLKYLRSSSHPLAKPIAKAIKDASSKNIDTPDKKWFDRIESLRKELLSSAEVLQRKDFGAGHALDIAENPELVIRTSTVSQLCKVAGIPKNQAKLLYHLAKELKPGVALELGTCLGISAAYQGAAIAEQGTLLTIEGDPATADLAQKNMTKLGLANVEVRSGAFAEVLPEILISLKQIDYVLIDGHHDGEAMKHYFALIKPWLTQNACVVFDDIDWSAGMQKAWKELQAQYPFVLAIDLGRVGIVIV